MRSRKAFDAVIHATQQHALRQHRKTGIGETRAGGAGIIGQFARVIAVKKDINRRASAQRRD